MVKSLEDTFPGLTRGGFSVTSPRNTKYNGIAWAAGDTNHWWWPIPDFKEIYWPPSGACTVSLAAFQDAFATLGYVECDCEDLEPGFEKVALFANDQGVPLHAARQLPGGRWTSKLGELEDIEHAWRDLEGTEYGSVAFVMKRSLEAGSHKEPSAEAGA